MCSFSENHYNPYLEQDFNTWQPPADQNDFNNEIHQNSNAFINNYQTAVHMQNSFIQQPHSLTSHYTDTTFIDLLENQSSNTLDPITRSFNEPGDDRSNSRTPGIHLVSSDSGLSGVSSSSLLDLDFQGYYFRVSSYLRRFRAQKHT